MILKASADKGSLSSDLRATVSSLSGLRPLTAGTSAGDAVVGTLREVFFDATPKLAESQDQDALVLFESHQVLVERLNCLSPL